MRMVHEIKRCKLGLFLDNRSVVNALHVQGLMVDGVSTNEVDNRRCNTHSLARTHIDT